MVEYGNFRVVLKLPKATSPFRPRVVRKSKGQETEGAIGQVFV